MPPRIKQWFLTYPQNDTSVIELLDHLKSIDTLIEYVVASEKHEDGNKHLHAYVKYLNGVFPGKLSVFDFNKHGNYQPCRSCKNVVQYCIKDGDFVTNIDLDSYLKKKGKKPVTIDVVKAKSTTQAFADGDISLMQARQYQYIRAMVQEQYTPLDLRGVWVWGPPGVGKSRMFHELDDPVYIKPQSKWWDGYDGEKIVLLDDLDTNVLGHYLKRWSDRYPEKGEIKGGQVQLQHDFFVVTSNYSIEQLFKDDDAMMQAVKRRFHEVYIADPSQVPKIPENKNLRELKRDINQYLAGKDGIVGDNRMTFTLPEVYGKENSWSPNLNLLPRPKLARSSWKNFQDSNVGTDFEGF